MTKRKVLGCAAGIGVALACLLAVSVVAVLLMELGVPEKILVKLGAMLGLAGMALGYHVSGVITRRPTNS